MDLEDSSCWSGFQEKSCLRMQILNWPPGFPKRLKADGHILLPAGSWDPNSSLISYWTVTEPHWPLLPQIQGLVWRPAWVLCSPLGPLRFKKKKKKSGSKRGIQRDPEEQLPQLSSIYNHSFLPQWPLCLSLKTFKPPLCPWPVSALPFERGREDVVEPQQLEVGHTAFSVLICPHMHSIWLFIRAHTSTSNQQLRSKLSK